jgi:NAD+ kinase
MKVFIFGQRVKTEDHPHIQSLISHLKDNKAEIYIFKAFKDQIEKEIPKIKELATWQHYHDIIRLKPDCIITLGGDGTILNALTYIRDSNIPILGINLGRLGFLASIEKRLMADAVHHLINGDRKSVV